MKLTFKQQYISLTLLKGTAVSTNKVSYKVLPAYCLKYNPTRFTHLGISCSFYSRLKADLVLSNIEQALISWMKRSFPSLSFDKPINEANEIELTKVSLMEICGYGQAFEYAEILDSSPELRKNSSRYPSLIDSLLDWTMVMHRKKLYLIGAALPDDIVKIYDWQSFPLIPR